MCRSMVHVMQCVALLSAFYQCVMRVVILSNLNFFYVYFYELSGKFKKARYYELKQTRIN